ncbi:hypothetical protein [Desulfosudis oleivorans]|uniref:Uncharacterized protein n=1 Tax=Desulfosudis oleivorans (strain DSM 6200 / JCM 39069 / Hxd3) TaxID=96561 RepID=A8ZVZ0_DESOH|nr:hypothetical protein [Desulfosudis oleivorans]ABW66699.1 hypothetical protein Dole_0889 [Desulfosudis oleivorans Hxd3]
MTIKKRLQTIAAAFLITVIVAGCVYTPIKTNEIAPKNFSYTESAVIYTDGRSAVVIDEAGGLALETDDMWSRTTPEAANLEKFLTGENIIAKQLVSIDPASGQETIEATLLQNARGLEFYFEKKVGKYTVKSPLSEQPEREKWPRRKDK